MPHYSRLALPARVISEQAAQVEGFDVVRPEALLILKQGAEEDRAHSVKGQKDRIDILTLLCHAPINFNTYRKMLEQHGLQRYRQRLKAIVMAFRDFKHLNTNPHEYAKIKRRLLKEI